MTEAQHVEKITQHAEDLCAAIEVASEDGVSHSVILPALLTVFREAGMFPENLDLGGIMGMLR